MNRTVNNQWEHLADAGKVVAATSVAVLTSFHDEIEWWLRVSVLLLTGAYTAHKLWQAWLAPRKGEKSDE